MSSYSPPWDSNQEPNESNVKGWLDNLYTKFNPLEQARWNEGNIDSLFYAGEQRFINSYFNFSPQYSWQNFHFNIIQQPINMVTGYQRQHRKSITYLPAETEDTKTTDQYTKLIMKANNDRKILEKYSRACEEACVTGMVLLQPFLDFRDDPVNGTLDAKIWSYNSFMVDPYFREPDMSDANFVWCQQYISKQEADTLFPERAKYVTPMQGSGQKYSRFYFLPENYNSARSDLLIMSYVWYKWRRKKKKIYNRLNGETFDYAGDDQELEAMMQQAGPDAFEVIEVEVPTWKLAVVLNDQLMWQGENPLGFDECPFTPIFWNYDPQLSYPNLRVRGLVRPARDSQYLTNRRIILNHDISESSINSGYKYKEDSISNPENLRYAGQGKDIIIKTGYEMTDLEKIIPNAVPPGDLQLADQMQDLIFKTTGVSMENFGIGDNATKDQSGLAIMLKQGAGLMVLQKYFDQWDTALSLFGNLQLKIIQNKWSVGKVARMLGEEPTEHFFSKMFAKYHVVVAEGVNTSVQQQLQFKQMLDLNQVLGGIIPPKFILQHSTIQGKSELIAALEEQQAQASAMEQQKQHLEAAVLDAKLKQSYATAASQVANARERHGRAESNIGLFEERLSEISQNRAMATKTKVEALEKLLDLVHRYGELEASLKASELETISYNQEQEEDREKADAKQTSLANDFVTSVLSNSMPPMQEQGGGEEMIGELQ
jgi:hypothetical protein